MDSPERNLAIFLYLLGVLSFGAGQGCDPADLDPSTVATLIAAARVTGDNPELPMVTVNDVTLVCLAADSTRGEYRFVSLVAAYSCTGRPDCDGDFTSQFDFSCASGAWVATLFGAAGDTFTDPADGTLSTDLRTNCSFCLSPRVNADVPFLGVDTSSIDVPTHCAPCSSQCLSTGARTCTGTEPENCCNAYDDDQCVVMCPAGEQPNENNECSVALEIQFVEVDRDIFESQQTATLTLRKTNENVGDLFLTLIPMTFSESGFIPSPVIDPAEESDFNREPQTVRFPASPATATMEVQVQVVNDGIHEATEGFVMVIQVNTTASDPQDVANVELIRNGIILITIRDDDAITLMFEQPTYTFSEDHGGLENDIFIIKADGRLSELDLNVVLQVTNITAEQGLDFQQMGRTLQFPAQDQRISVGGEILEDLIFEIDETFQLGLGTPPGATFMVGTPTVITIMDNERAVIGFEQTTFTVEEEEGSVEVCVAYLEPDQVMIDAGNAPILTFSTSSEGGTAEEDDDYTPIDTTFVLLTTQMCFNVFITDDNDTEATETFNVTLGGVILPPRTELNPTMATITIVDTDVEPQCPDPPPLVNGMVTFTGNSIGDTATYACNSGFELIGSATATCGLVSGNVNVAVFAPAPPECRIAGGCRTTGLDLFFVLDSSESINFVDPGNFMRLLQSVSDIVGEFDIGLNFNETRVGVIRFASGPNLIFDLDTHTDLSSLQAAILAVQYVPGGTRTNEALDLLANSFTEANGARSLSLGIPRAAIVITDGLSEDPNATAMAAQNVCESAIIPFAAGIGNTFTSNQATIGPGMAELLAIACGNASRVEIAEDFSTEALMELQVNITDFSCQVERLCDNPPPLVNGMVTFTGNSIGDTATYTCNSGFELIGSATATCGQVENATIFSPAPPECRPPPVVSFCEAAVEFSEAAGMGTICVRVSDPRTGQSPVSITITGGPGNQPDTVIVSGSDVDITFLLPNADQPGNELVFNFAITNDQFSLEDAEVYSLQLTSSDPDIQIVDPSVLQVTITNDDPAILSLRQDQVLFVENLAAPALFFDLTPIARPITVELVGVPINPSSAIITSLGSFMVLQNLTEEDRVRERGLGRVNISLTDDNVGLEDLERVLVTLSAVAPQGFDIRVEPRNQTEVVIIDDDFVTVGMVYSEISVIEPTTGTLSFELCANASNPVARSVTVNFSLQDGSATAPPDYVGGNFNETLQPRTCINPTIIADSVDEGDENFIAVLSLATTITSGIALDPTRTTTNVIIEEIVLLVTVGLVDTDIRVREPATGQTEVEVCANVTSPIPQGLEVQFTTADGDAQAGLDYTQTSLQIPLDSSPSCITVPILADMLLEPDESFTVSLSLVGNPSGVVLDPDRAVATITIEDFGLIRNDTIIGDPLFTVPIFGMRERVLCYEIHGAAGQYFNLISDECVSVNARYVMRNQVIPNPSPGQPNIEVLHVLDQIGIRAVDNAGSCVNLAVNLDECSLMLSGSFPTQQFNSNGIRARAFSRHVRISVPNCEDTDLVMRVFCENVSGVEMLKFVVSRGLNLRETAHGLVGQFWNIPVTVERFTGEVREDNGDDIYIVTVTTPSGDQRAFPASLEGQTWDGTSKDCLYAGSRQGGPIYEVENPNNPVIEGNYRQYRVDGPFATEFMYSHFDDARCTTVVIG